MSFLRKATLNINGLFERQASGNFEWRSFVKEANEKLPMDTKDFLPPEAFEYDTKNFVYLTARAISGMEKWGPNGNGDAFPWNDLMKSYPSFIGRGFYIEHIEDSDTDAKGIILDAQPDTENEFIVCVCAIDKNEYPEICEQITSGKLNQVSMSCLSEECECSKCHNVAHSNAELCSHMNSSSPATYCKNCKDENDELVYEINRNLIFTGLSGVAVPADKDAFVFDIKASKKKVDNLKEQFNKYLKAKYLQSGAMKNLQQEVKSCVENESVFNVISNVSKTLSQVLQQLLSNEQDHAQCNLATFASTLNEIARCKFMLEGCKEMNEQKQENSLQTNPVEEEKNNLEENKIIESTKKENKFKFSKLKIASKKQFWTKL